jgi:hypothetical protein|tara:strand:+ start:384 stop:530 length:147 start_codon:yes stop_codon:yes gene_type:complete
MDYPVKSFDFSAYWVGEGFQEKAQMTYRNFSLSSLRFHDWTTSLDTGA